MSGKYFIVIEGDRYGNDSVINPDGRKIPFDTKLFDDPEEIEVDNLLSNRLINDIQLREYKRHIKLERYYYTIQQQKSHHKKILSDGGKFSFVFEINKSFLENGYITIPPKFNHYLLGTARQNDSCDVHLISINGRQINAHLYHGQAGWGEYFQLRMKGKSVFIYDGGFEGKAIGDTIQVIFEGDISSPKFILKTS